MVNNWKDERSHISEENKEKIRSVAYKGKPPACAAKM
jgi:hypothetical protein